MKVIVCGGRDFQNVAFVYLHLDKIHAVTPITALMHGAAKGVDSIASDWARDHGIQTWVCRADWDKYGKGAGAIRNKRMLEWGPDMVIVFPGGNGIALMVRRAVTAGVAVHKVRAQTTFQSSKRRKRKLFCA